MSFFLNFSYNPNFAIFKFVIDNVECILSEAVDHSLVHQWPESMRSIIVSTNMLSTWYPLSMVPCFTFAFSRSGFPADAPSTMSQIYDWFNSAKETSYHSRILFRNIGALWSRKASMRVLIRLGFWRSLGALVCARRRESTNSWMCTFLPTIKVK